MQELEEKRLEMKAEKWEKMANNNGSKTTQLTAHSYPVHPVPESRGVV